VVLGITAVIVAIIVLGIFLVLADANRANMLVDFFVDLAWWFTKPFHSLFAQRNPEQDVLLNWGLAAIVYLIIGGFIARLARW
jgi:predicted membrane channel-forming protein YqfA (hemolysin III family)